MNRDAMNPAAAGAAEVGRVPSAQNERPSID